MAQQSVVSMLWAKTDPFHPLYCHLLDVGYVALSLLGTATFRRTADKFSGAAGCTVEQAEAWLAYLASLHDIGKCHADFQGKGPESLVKPLTDAGLCCTRQDSRFEHEAMSGWWVRRYLIDVKRWDARAASTISAAIRGHHGDFRVDDPIEDCASALHRQWEPLRRELASLLEAAFVPPSWRPSLRDHSVVGVLLSGLLVLSDWIGSNAELLPRVSGVTTVESYGESSKENARRALARLGYGSGVRWTTGMAFSDVWPGIQHPRSVQTCCEESCREVLEPGLAIVEAPMGEGKTEAAIYLATQWAARSGAQGAYIALPTAATSNQMFNRYRGFLESHDATGTQGIKLVHGMAWLVDDTTPEQAPELSSGSDRERGVALDWFRPRKRSMLATEAVGTIDQALMSVLHVRHGFLRLLGLSGKVLIVDEVHAYDAYMSRILTLVLQWCRALEIPVILLSATLPQARREMLMTAYNRTAYAGTVRPGEVAPYPLVTFVDRDGNVRERQPGEPSKRLTVRLAKHEGLLGSPSDIAALVADRARLGGCLCVIANTVDSAQRIYKELGAILIDGMGYPGRLLLFHARFRAEHRQGIEEQALRFFDKRSLSPDGDPALRPTHAVLVATQVVEQSLDLDFDEMFTEMAPIDLILQRVGRLHRHDRGLRPTGTEPVLHVLMPVAGRPVFGATERVYHRFMLLKTLLVLDGLAALDLPKDIRALVEAVYGGSREAGRLSGVVDPDDLDSAYRDLDRQMKEEADQARRYLIPPPNEMAFGLSRVPAGAFDDDESDASSYFTAKTRLDDDNRRLLLLEGDACADVLTSRRAPRRAIMKQMFLQTVNVPGWWLADALPEPGFAVPERGPTWMPGMTVLRLREGRWVGRKRAGGVFVIRDDAKLGIIREEEGGA